MNNKYRPTPRVVNNTQKFIPTVRSQINTQERKGFERSQFPARNESESIYTHMSGNIDSRQGAEEKQYEDIMVQHFDVNRKQDININKYQQQQRKVANFNIHERPPPHPPIPRKPNDPRALKNDLIRTGYQVDQTKQLPTFDYQSEEEETYIHPNQGHSYPLPDSSNFHSSSSAFNRSHQAMKSYETQSAEEPVELYEEPNSYPNQPPRSPHLTNDFMSKTAALQNRSSPHHFAKSPEVSPHSSFNSKSSQGSWAGSRSSSSSAEDASSIKRSNITNIGAYKVASLMNNNRFDRSPDLSCMQMPSFTPKVFCKTSNATEDQTWFRNCDRNEAKKILFGLRSRQVGSFLVRPGTHVDGPHPYSLTVISHIGEESDDFSIINLKIRRRSDNLLALGTPKESEMTFENVKSLIEHHLQTNFKLAEGQGYVQLKNPQF